MPFITRAYNTVEFREDLKTLVKKSNEERLKDEINYYKNLPLSVSLYFPRIFRSKTDSIPYEFEMEYYSYSNLAKYYFEENNENKKFWLDVFNSLLSSINMFKKQKSFLEKKEVQDCCKQMFIDKTIKEYLNLNNNFKFFKDLNANNTLIINNKKYNNFDNLWKELEPLLNKIISEEINFNVIHGDMCFSNILYGYNKDLEYKTVKFIDPRGSFGLKGIYGSSLYDYAKIMHSIDGNYESFIYDNFKINNTNNNFILEYFSNDTCIKIYKDLLDKETFLKAKIIQGLIFIGMCARHYDSIERQKAMYLTGIRILNEVLDEDMC